ncbi:hypothetical protein WA026_016224 [Henosepilachna vigintioctopunctata]|uniref:Platelet-derived growth factor (PDGF) family profile domain-containing protein n=1 Tax=Henosepilachna vigintioctopunctata TaxID=420089 RepID=A0AAW1TLC5_9CUCU
MSTMHVSYNPSRCPYLLLGCSVVLFVSNCVYSTKPSQKNEVKFPDDVIVFPNEEYFDSKEKRSDEKYRQVETFVHNRDFHKYHGLPPPVFDGRTGHSHDISFHQVKKETPAPTWKYPNASVNMIPLDFIEKINRCTNVDEILHNYVKGEEDESSIIEDRFGGERNAAIRPKPASCIPELQTVKLVTSEDASVLYIPECTRIERCGGCCSHHLLSCQPTEKQEVTFSVTKTQYIGTSLKFVGKELVVLEKHNKCKCDCRIKAEDCTQFQQYNKQQCRCICKNSDEERKCYRKNQTKLWDPELCRCECRDVTPCSTGFEFDHIECRCLSKPTRSRYSEAEPRIFNQD